MGSVMRKMARNVGTKHYRVPLQTITHISKTNSCPSKYQRSRHPKCLGDCATTTNIESDILTLLINKPNPNKKCHSKRTLKQVLVAQYMAAAEPSSTSIHANRQLFYTVQCNTVKWTWHRFPNAGGNNSLANMPSRTSS